MENNNLGPLMPGMMFENGIIGGKFTYERTNQDGFAVFRESRVPIKMDELRPISITPEILRDWFRFKEIGNQGVLFILDDLQYRIHAPFRMGEIKWGVQAYWKDGDGLLEHINLIGIRYTHDLQRLLAGLGLEYRVKIKSNETV